MYLDLAELPQVFAGRWLWSAEKRAVASFNRSDYLGPAGEDLDSAVRNLVEARTGVRPSGPIRLLTHLRYFGYCFNPVSFYYCFSADDSRLETIVAEITNTPWGERHAYVLPEASNLGTESKKRFTFSKEFHISPFAGMEITHDWFFNTPGAALSVHMENLEKGSKSFDATLSLRRVEITTANLAAVLLRFPLMTVKVMAAIHWNAFRLWLKRCPVYTHPARLEDREARES